MNDPILMSAGAGGERLNILQKNPIMTRVGGVLLLTLVLAVLLAVLLAAPAHAEPRIKVGGCKVYATNYVDPIAFSDHLHRQIGNTSTTNESTGQSLFESGTTSCDMDWFTSAAWFPVERYEPVRGASVYYRAPGDQTEIRQIPKGLQLLGTIERYNCDGAPGASTPFQSSPVYSCQDNWGTQVSFPDCWNQTSLEETSMAYSVRPGECPSTHPYRIPKITILVGHSNLDGEVPNPLTVSAGVGEWADYTHMHADYFAANQRVFNRELLDLCLRNAPDSVTVADPRCGEAR